MTPLEYYQRQHGRHMEVEPRPCRTCHTAAHMDRTTRPVALQSRGGTTSDVPWWRCRACGIWGLPAIATPLDTYDWYQRWGAAPRRPSEVDL